MCALAEIRDCDAQFGTTTLDGLLANPVPICGVMGDSQAAMFAHRCFDVGSAKATLGSGSSVLLNVGECIPGVQNGAVASLAWVRNGRATYALEGIINCCAASLTWLRDQLGVIVNIEDAEQIARTADGEQTVYLVPAFSGMGAPYWRDEARAAIVGLSPHSNRAHVVRAALDAIAYQLRDVLEMMQSESATPLRQLRCDGGATQIPLLMQFTADVLGIELRVANQPNYSALGAAMMATTGLGWHTSPASIAALDFEETTYRPSANVDQANVGYRGWQRAVRQVLNTA